MIDVRDTLDVLGILGALLGVGVAGVSLFVTRFEHSDMLRRMARVERWQDNRDEVNGPAVRRGDSTGGP